MVMDHSKNDELTITSPLCHRMERLKPQGLNINMSPEEQRIPTAFTVVNGTQTPLYTSFDMEDFNCAKSTKLRIKEGVVVLVGEGEIISEVNSLGSN